jgi:2-polyprenyl-3-methyl-5-hydroxy-6-metoxy-1,4-benzoquinol methylase
MQANELTKHDVLTEQEMANFVFNSRILKQLERCRKKLNLEKDQMNILDWGCGRGRAVVWLREQGYKAFGVDIDLEPVENCRNLLSSRGVNPDSLIYLIQNNTAKEFPDKHFHFIFSYGVFEHIKDLDQVAAEFKRIMAPEAIGAHFFPAHKHLVETHLRMPFLHWLPKNGLRMICFKSTLMLGKGPKWKELQGMTKEQQAQVYYNYTVSKTFYRSPALLREVFSKVGLNIEFISLDDYGVDEYPVLKALVKIKPLRPFLNWAMRNFGRVGLLITNDEISD